MYITAIFIVVVLLFVDIVSKIFVTQMQGPTTVISNFFYINYIENRGAAWGIGQGRQMLFIVFAVLFCIGMIYFMSKINKKNKLLFYCVPVVIAGTLGNCLDRILNGYVVDFLQFNFWGKTFPIFNFADICIVCGTVVIAAVLIFSKDEKIFEKKRDDKEN